MKLRRLFKAAAFIFLLGTVVWWLKSDFWQIKRISCYSNRNPCSEQIWAGLMNKTLGRNIFTLSSKKLSQQIKQDHPEFFQIEIKKEFPNGLLFEIEIRKAVVAIGQEGGDFYLVDRDGVLLKKTNEPIDLSGTKMVRDLPTIFFSDNVNQEIGTKIQNDLILTTIQILYESELRLLKPKSTWIVSEKAVRTLFENELEVLFSIQKNPKKQVDSLQFILERTKIEGVKLKRIDLRFDKPIIVK